MEGEVTQLLRMYEGGDRAALDRLAPLLYDELRHLADSLFRRESPGHTLQPTAVVNEAYLRLVDQKAPFSTRAHFLGIAARIMRQILVDHSRSRLAAKRGGGAAKVPLDQDDYASPEPGSEMLSLNEALDRLAAVDERKARIVELRYFGGLTGEEIAVSLGVGTATVTRDLRVAEAWLAHALKG